MALHRLQNLLQGSGSGRTGASQNHRRQPAVARSSSFLSRIAAFSTGKPPKPGFSPALSRIGEGEVNEHYSAPVGGPRLQEAIESLLEPDDVAFVQSTWADIREEHAGDSVAALFYIQLFTLDPSLEHLFLRTRCVQHVMFTEMVDTLVASLTDGAYCESMLLASSLRHLRYGVKMDQFPTVGKALVGTLEAALEDRWTPEVAGAWTRLWEKMVDVMSTHIDVDPLVRAIARGSLDMTRLEIERTPRCERVNRMLRQLADEQTPLSRAITDRRVEIARYMVKDILSIRSDRTGYYYGREQLWKAHPDIVYKIATAVPSVLPDLLTGLRWVSTHTDGGVRRVNYYLEGLWGRPEDPAYSTPLAHMLLLKSNDAFAHPVTEMLVFQKWRLFGRTRFFVSQLANLLMLIVLLVGYVAFNGRTAGLPLRVLVWIWSSAKLTLELLRIARLGWTRLPINGLRLHIPSYFLSFDNIVRFLPYALTLTLIPLEVSWNSEARKEENIILAFVIIMQFFQMLHLFLASRELASFAFTISRMIYDVLKFLSAFVIIWLGFAFSFYILLGQTDEHFEFHNPSISMVTLFGMMLGFSDFNFRELDNPIGGVSISLWFLYLLLVNILLLNLLIAQMATSYKQVKRASDAFTLRRLAEEMVEIEHGLTKKDRQWCWDSLCFDQPLEFDEYDVGPAGGIQVLEEVGLDYGVEANQSLRLLRFSGPSDPSAPWPKDPATPDTIDYKLAAKAAGLATSSRYTNPGGGSSSGEFQQIQCQKSKRGSPQYPKTGPPAHPRSTPSTPPCSGELVCALKESRRSSSVPKSGEILRGIVMRSKLAPKLARMASKKAISEPATPPEEAAGNTRGPPEGQGMSRGERTSRRSPDRKLMGSLERSRMYRGSSEGEGTPRSSFEGPRTSRSPIEGQDTNRASSEGAGPSRGFSEGQGTSRDPSRGQEISESSLDSRSGPSTSDSPKAADLTTEEDSAFHNLTNMVSFSFGGALPGGDSQPGEDVLLRGLSELAEEGEPSLACEANHGRDLVGDANEGTSGDEITQSSKMFELEEVAEHNNVESAWIAINSQVYDITNFIPLHPGGQSILQGLGQDATLLYRTVGHSSTADQLMESYRIGGLLSCHEKSL